MNSRPQMPRSLWSAPRIATSEKVQHRKSAIQGLPITLRMLRFKSDKSDWLRIGNDYFAHALKSWPSQRPLRARMQTYQSTTVELKLKANREVR